MSAFEQINTKEIREIKDATEGIYGKAIKAFENKMNDVNALRRITTINEDLEGKKYPETDVEYKRKVITLNGEKIEGVFPEFPSVFDTQLPKELWKASDVEQFRYCTQKLKERIERDPEFAKQFTPTQIEQIKKRSPRISGLTWHHTEVPGKMQLVDAKLHDKCRHTGGRNIWGGGSDCR